MAIVADFVCEKCQQQFVLTQGMQIQDIIDNSDNNGGQLPEFASLSSMSHIRTNLSVIDFINALELHKEKCEGKVVYIGNREG
jgi:hypothetical protein